MSTNIGNHVIPSRLSSLHSSTVNKQASLAGTNEVNFQKKDEVVSTKSANDTVGSSISQATMMSQTMMGINNDIGKLEATKNGLNQIRDVTTRMLELANQSTNPILTSSDRGHLNGETEQLTSQIDRMTKALEFQGTKLLDGSANGAVNTTTSNLFSSKTVDISKQEGAQEAKKTLGDAMTKINEMLALNQTELEKMTPKIEQALEPVTSSESKLRNVDFAAESASFSRKNLENISGSMKMAQSNTSAQNVMRLLQ
jgi:flagellin